MQLDLVDRRHDVGAVDQRAEVLQQHHACALERRPVVLVYPDGHERLLSIDRPLVIERFGFSPIRFYLRVLQRNRDRLRRPS